MSVPALVPNSAVSLWTPQDVALIRRTSANGATDDEFSVFLKTARELGLSPIRKHIFCLIYNPDKPDKRSMSIVTAIDGFRFVADSTGNYRPDSEAPVFTYLPWKIERDQALSDIRAEAAKERDLRIRKAFLFDQMQALDDLYPIDPLNPEGIEKVTARLFKFSHDGWHVITAEAYWAEYAPIRDEWAEVEINGKMKWRPSGQKTLDTSGMWGKMPRGQLEKCAEAKCHRKASWCGALSNVYAEQEVDRQRYIDLTPVEMAELGTQQARLERVEKRDHFLISWTGAANETPEEVSGGSLPDRVFAFIDANRDAPQVVEDWQARNRHSLRVYHAAHKSDALEIKRRVEAVLAPRVAA